MLDLKALKVISIQKNQDIYHVVYMKNDSGKHEMEILKNGFICNESIKPLILSYARFLECDVDNSKTTYQIFDILYKKLYKVN